MGNQWVARITSGATSAVWWLTSGLVVLVAGIYLAASPDSYVGGLLHLTPPKQRDAARELLARMHTALRGWLAGVLVEMTVIGVGYAVGLWLLDVPMALAVGLCAFVLCFVPYLGALIAGVLAIAVGFSVDTRTAMWVVGLTVILQGLESYVLTPMVYRRSVHLPPVVTLGAQLILFRTRKARPKRERPKRPATDTPCASRVR
jgi:predicted PurR-regulated permease PerM